MNGYLNNLTLRTLNTGNRVEPRLPALFEPGVFESAPPPAVERSGPFEEEVTTVSEPAAPRVKTAEPGSGETLPDGPGVTKPGIEASPVVPKSPAVKPDEDVETRFEPVAHEEKREEPVADLTVQATLQPRPETVEIATPRKTEDAETPPIFEEVEERLTPSVEIDDSALLRLVSRPESHKPAVTSDRIPKRNPEAQPAVSIRTQSPETDQFQTQLRLTTPPNNPEAIHAPIEVTHNEEISEIEQRVTNKPEPEPEFESTKPSTYQRVNPTPATWRDTRQQQWRRRQPPASIESEPAINVTIGRIEVRAVPADTRKTTAPRRSESPVMPLEDYLRKQRRGGER